MKNLTKDQFISDLSQLISFKTLTSNKEEIKKALDFIESKISKKAIIKRLKNKSSEILIASNKDTKTPNVCFLVHIDVVAGREDQFEMKIKKSIAYGRGVSDMKFSIPLGYALLNDLIEANSSLSFSLVITTDEETGGFEGAAYLAENYKLKPKVFLVPDGGDNFVFINKAKGVCALKIESKGIPAHASRIWEGKNALEPLIKLCYEVLKKYEKNNKSETMKTTVNIGKMEGGISSNQVCPEAFVILDFRFPETTSFQELSNEVEALAKKTDPTLKISVYSQGKPTAVDKNNEFVQRYIKNLERTIRRKIEIKPTYGASDARHFADLKAPVLMIKPNGGDIHGSNEYIDIDSCILFYKATWEFLQEIERNKKSLSWHR